MADITFAQYDQFNGAAQQWSIATSGDLTTVTASGTAEFTFSGVSGLPFSGPELANFSLSATSSQLGSCGDVNCPNGDSYTQPGYIGTFSFIDAGSGANLLSGTFAVTSKPASTGAQLGSSVGGTGGQFNASSSADNLAQLVLTSAYLDFAGQTEETASWSLSSLSPAFAVSTPSGTQAYPAAGTFVAAGAGTFSSTSAPAVAPEPATFALLGGALLALGLMHRRKSLLAR